MNRLCLTLSLAAALAGVAPATLAAKKCPEPQVFAPGVISRPGNNWESRLTLSPDRSVALWTVGNFFAGEQLTILVSHATKQGWSEPVVASFSGTYSDVDTVFSPDGRTVYFSSLRPIVPGGEPRADFDLWRVSVTSNGFGTPVHLAGPSTDANELYPSIDRDGNLYFGSDRDAQWDVWRSARQANGAFSTASKLSGAVNTDDYWEFNPEISPNGKTLLFVSLLRPEGYGWGDIYRSNLRADGFTPAANLGPCVNSNADDYHPTMLWDEGELIYLRNFIEDPDWYPDFFIIPVDLD
jgi:Tol biopolymer transport system component